VRRHSLRYGYMDHPFGSKYPNVLHTYNTNIPSITTNIIDTPTNPTPVFFTILAPEDITDVVVELSVAFSELIAAHADMNVAFPWNAVNFICAAAALVLISASSVVFPFVISSNSVWLFAKFTNFCSLFMTLHSSFCCTAGQAACKVELLVSVCSLTAALDALVWILAILVALLLVAIATAVVLAANLMKRWSMKVSWQPSSSAAWASNTVQNDTRVAFDWRVWSLVVAEEALALISAIFVALLLVISPSLVVLDASSMRWLSLFISLHCDFSERLLWHLAATEVARREIRIDWKCMLELFKRRK